MADNTCSTCRYWKEDEDPREGYGKCHADRYSKGGPLAPEGTRVACTDWKGGD